MELTMHLELATTRRVGRKKEWPEEIRLSLAGGTLDRIAGVLEPEEYRLDMIREAIEREIKRRERAIKASPPSPRGPAKSKDAE
jgi:hypothetical protein